MAKTIKIASETDFLDNLKDCASFFVAGPGSARAGICQTIEAAMQRGVRVRAARLSESDA